jgi:hypothetical protein
LRPEAGGSAAAAVVRLTTSRDVFVAPTALVSLREEAGFAHLLESAHERQLINAVQMATLEKSQPSTIRLPAQLFVGMPAATWL